MELQTFQRRHLLCFRSCIVGIHVAQGLQYIAALGGKISHHIDKMPAPKDLNLQHPYGYSSMRVCQFRHDRVLYSNSFKLARTPTSS
jgi:hypothetical protein